MMRMFAHAGRLGWGIRSGIAARANYELGRIEEAQRGNLRAAELAPQRPEPLTLKTAVEVRIQVQGTRPKDISTTPHLTKTVNSLIAPST